MGKAKNLKLLLCAFEQLSGLKINFHKSELFCVGTVKDHEQEYREIFGCGLDTFPFRYLGIPMHHKRINSKDWRCIEEIFEKKAKYMSYGGTYIFMSKWSREKRYRLTKWKIICRPVEQGGVGS